MCNNFIQFDSTRTGAAEIMQQLYHRAATQRPPAFRFHSPLGSHVKFLWKKAELRTSRLIPSQERQNHQPPSNEITLHSLQPACSPNFASSRISQHCSPCFTKRSRDFPHFALLAVRQDCQEYPDRIEFSLEEEITYLGRFYPLQSNSTESLRKPAHVFVARAWKTNFVFDYNTTQNDEKWVFRVCGLFCGLG
jgi:hypothetical protein